ncbi:MAG: endonuclease/exonuclease/phosphatase family protein [Candidatus Helarchaeota archaeon]
MPDLTNYLQKRYNYVAVLAILFLFFLELIAKFIESVYALCLLTLSLNENVLSVLFLFTPVILIFFGKRTLSNTMLFIFGESVVVCRILLPLLTTQLQMLVAGLGVGCFLVFLLALIQKIPSSEQEQKSLLLGGSFGLAVLVSILLRALGSSTDLSMYGSFQVIGWVLCAIVGILLCGLIVNKPKELEEAVSTERDGKPARLSKIIALAIGMIAIMLLIYSTFASPTVIARWTEGDYLLILIVLSISMLVGIVLLCFKPSILEKLKMQGILIWNLVFIGMLVLTIALNQVNFPAESVAYPILAPPTHWAFQIPLLLMLVSSPVLLVDFTLLSREIIRRQPNTRTIGGAFSIASIVFLLLIFSEIFTTTYDYIPDIGPFFRDMFWFVFLLIGLAIFLPLFLIKTRSLLYNYPLNGIRTRAILGVLLIVITFGAILGGALLQAKPTIPSTVPSSIKIMTYNIQQGYDANGQWAFDTQLAVIQNESPDILALQESDIARLSGGNADIVRYFADKLNMFAYYGPKTVVGTFGLALLSKYPIEHALTFYVYSIGEQIACIEAAITINTTTFNIFVAHPAGPEPVTQQQQMLSRIAGKNNVIFLGDFNFEPLTEPYNLTTALLNDSWEIASSQIIGSLPPDWVTRFPNERIDHIFVSPGTVITSCKYFGGSASDHPAALIELQL